MSAGRYSIVLTSLPTDADKQREQLVRRVASADPGIDIIGMDVIWAAEFAEAGWILPWPASTSERVSLGRLPAAVEIARLQTRLGTTTMIFITHDQIEAMTLGDRAGDEPGRGAKDRHATGALLPSGQPVRRRLYWFSGFDTRKIQLFDWVTGRNYT